jgi:ABC-type Mn2+/Zn2+ transport system ATPase subunit
MTAIVNIPRVDNEPLNIARNQGDILFILGANGTGKSTLIQSLFKNFRSENKNVKRILAHRQTWLQSNALTISPYDKQNIELNIRQNTSPTLRWRDDNGGHAASLSIYNLVDGENARARKIALHVDERNINDANKLSEDNPSPIKMLNELLRISNFSIEIEIEENNKIIAKKRGFKPYSAAELSDGERNALLIAAEVLTATPNMIILLDEPERHLHRSIISPLLTSLFKMRNDCIFIISTHDLMLPIDNPDAQTVLIRSCTYNCDSSDIQLWEADILPQKTEIDEDLKKDILGGRKKILFVEGKESSLDKPLYSILFPNVSVVAKSSCRDVEYAVVGISASQHLAWLTCMGYH